jgi:hypothetical protein
MEHDQVDSLRHAARSRAGHAMARIGLGSRGAVYLLMGALIILLAMGLNGEPVDQKGVLAQVVALPAGTVITLLMIIGFLGYAMWRASEAVFGAQGPKGRQFGPRAKSAARALIYLAMAGTALFVLAGSRTEQAEQQEDVAASVMQLPGGQIIVAIAGLVVIGVGIGMMVEGYRCDFLRMFQARPAPQLTIIRHLGRVGTMARGAVFTAIGFLVLIAAITRDADKAGGIDTTMRALLDLPFGGGAVFLAGLGLVIFAIYGFTEAAFRRV